MASPIICVVGVQVSCSGTHNAKLFTQVYELVSYLVTVSYTCETLMMNSTVLVFSTR